ncbi:MAG: hypothetical protein AAB439_03245 [Patescibacteria group bacterium]
MNRTHTTREVSFAYEKRILFGVGVVILSLMVMYTYFVSLSIAHAVSRESYVRESEGLVDTVAALEREYLTRSNSMTERVAYGLGYVPISTRVYVERGVLSLGNAR